MLETSGSAAAYPATRATEVTREAAALDRAVAVASSVTGKIKLSVYGRQSNPRLEPSSPD